MYPDSFAGFRFDLGHLLKRSNVVLHTYNDLSLPRVQDIFPAKKSYYLIIGRRGFGCEDNL